MWRAGVCPGKAGVGSRSALSWCSRGDGGGPARGVLDVALFTSEDPGAGLLSTCFFFFPAHRVSSLSNFYRNRLVFFISVGVDKKSCVSKITG